MKTNLDGVTLIENECGYNTGFSGVWTHPEKLFDGILDTEKGIGNVIFQNDGINAYLTIESSVTFRFDFFMEYFKFDGNDKDTTMGQLKIIRVSDNSVIYTFDKSETGFGWQYMDKQTFIEPGKYRIVSDLCYITMSELVFYTNHKININMNNRCYAISDGILKTTNEPNFTNNDLTIENLNRLKIDNLLFLDYLFNTIGDKSYKIIKESDINA